MNIKELGPICSQWRLECGYTQQQIAEALGMSPESISAFEHGRTNNANILLWYIEHGFKI
jgi:transcriptional regulator with XRE-family HTH domain